MPELEPLRTTPEGASAFPAAESGPTTQTAERSVLVVVIAASREVLSDEYSVPQDQTWLSLLIHNFRRHKHPVNQF